MLNIIIFILSLVSISLACLSIYSFSIRYKNIKKRKKETKPKPINKHLEYQFNNRKEIVNISPEKENSCFNIRANKNKLTTVVDEISELGMAATASSLLEYYSIPRNCFNVRNVIQNINPSFKTKKKNNNPYYVYSSEGISIINSLKPDTEYIFPVIGNYYSSKIETYPGQNIDSITDLANKSKEFGKILSNLENEIFLRSLFYHKNTDFYYEIDNIGKIYRPCLNLEKQNIKRYVLILPEKYFKVHTLIIEEIKSSLKKDTLIIPTFCPDFILEKYGIFSLILEATEELNITVFTDLPIMMTASEYGNNTYIEGYNSIGFVIGNLQKVSICFSNENYKLLGDRINDQF